MSSRTLWMGELISAMNEENITQMWSQMGYTVTVKLVRDKTTQKSLYCFVEFPTPEAATGALQFNQCKAALNEMEVVLKLGWANNQVEYSLFVGDIPNMNDQQLSELFKLYNSSSAKVVIDPQTQHTKGYGFVRFKRQEDQQRALFEMNGLLV
jgi:RNA recognition motif-containing protein